jgi:hypothetical protein
MVTGSNDVYNGHGYRLPSDLFLLSVLFLAKTDACSMVLLLGLTEQGGFCDSHRR